MRAGPTRHRVALAVALAGAALSVVTLVVHKRLASDTGYTSFCNLGGVIDCDAVMGSRYSTLLGVPVAGLGLAAFVGGVVLALPGAFAGAGGGLADLLLLGLASASLGFAAVLGVAMASIGKLCLLCLSTDLIIIAWFLTVLPLASRFEANRETGWWRRRGAARAIATAGAVVAIAGGTLAAVRGPAAARSVDEIRERDPKFYDWYTQLPVRRTDELATAECHRRGEPGATVAIVEFSDFQCPYCVQAFRDLRDLMRSRPDVSLVFRHFPLDAACNENVKHSMHPDACLAACAAECAGRQGRFWEYHDVLFENHEHLERESLFRYARETNLDLASFRTCLDDPATRARVGEDIAAGTRAGVASTPTIFFNGRQIEGALEQPYYDYAVIIEQHAGHSHGSERAS